MLRSACLLGLATLLLAAAGDSSAQQATGLAGQTCPSPFHARYMATGPDGNQYPTWHPSTHSGTGCYFGHEHGDDPATANAGASPPLFGYVNQVAGISEPHEGFKVFVERAGQVADNGLVADADMRLVFHMGTSGVGRYNTRFHSMEYDYIERRTNGLEFHIRGLADTGDNALVGSTCTLPRGGSRDFSTLGCADRYEIWPVVFTLYNPAGENHGPFQDPLVASASVAAFDPITTRDPLNPTLLIYTQSVKPYQGLEGIDPQSASSPFRGCNREFYSGPNYTGQYETPALQIVTNVYGRILRIASNPGAGELLQRIGPTYGARATNQIKLPSIHCEAGVHTPN